MDDLGVGYEALKTINAQLVYATGSGYGITGPDRDNLAMDFTIQAQSGIMSVTGFPDGPPVKAGPTLVDFMGGIHLYAAVVTALLQRERTGLGQLVEVAMQETVYSSLASSMEYHVRTGGIPPPPVASNRQVQMERFRPAQRRLDDPRGTEALEEPGEGDGARGAGRRIRVSPHAASPIWGQSTRRWPRHAHPGSRVVRDADPPYCGRAVVRTARR
jgi:hypothetical protein